MEGKTIKIYKIQNQNGEFFNDKRVWRRKCDAINAFRHRHRNGNERDFKLVEITLFTSGYNCNEMKSIAEEKKYKFITVQLRNGRTKMTTAPILA